MARTATGMRSDSVLVYPWLALVVTVLATVGVLPTTTAVSEPVITDSVTSPASTAAAATPVVITVVATLNTAPPATIEASPSSHPTTVVSSTSATTVAAVIGSKSSESETTTAATSDAAAGTTSGMTSAATSESTATTTTPAVGTTSPKAGGNSNTELANSIATVVPSTSISTTLATSEPPTTTPPTTTPPTTTPPTTTSSSTMPMPVIASLAPTVSHSDIIIITVPSVVCGVTVIVVIVGLAVHCQRRRRIPAMRRIIPPFPSRPTSTPPELVKLSKPVNLVDFPEYLKHMSADSCYGFAEEFDGDLKDVGRHQPTIAASLEHNLVKNRFTNILPYDHSRVKLFTSGGPDKSDYINANYIPGHNGAKEFIATQGPMHSTVNDFWRMVWEQQCKSIVMLTRCTEGLVDKCHHYWPPGHDTVTYDGVTVQVTDELEQPHWKVTDFSVSATATAATDAVSSSNGGASSMAILPLQQQQQQQRHVRHFHYTAFPDHRAPPDVESMLQFTRLVRSKLTRSPGGPVVVHCSAGVGRSGTYIAIDRILQQIEDGCSSVDVFGVVREMRMHRMHMVQAEEQYIFIHQIIAQELQQRRHPRETQNVNGIENEAFAAE